MTANLIRPRLRHSQLLLLDFLFAYDVRYDALAIKVRALSEAGSRSSVRPSVYLSHASCSKQCVL